MSIQNFIRSKIKASYNIHFALSSGDLVKTFKLEWPEVIVLVADQTDYRLEGRKCSSINNRNSLISNDYSSPDKRVKIN